MRDILDPTARWIGTPGGAFSSSNKRPVAIDDTLSVLKDSGPVTVPVLANDFDPEGATLTLISATAALGTAVAEADQTVTYTPPPGISGFDTIVYEIADDLDQRTSGQVNVTVTELQLTIDTQPDNTLTVTAPSGQIDLTITNPTSFAGIYQIEPADLAGGPVNLVAPIITGTPNVGNIIAATEGLWAYDTGAGLPAGSWQWRRAGADIPGETAASYTIQAGDAGLGLSVVETQTDSFGQRAAESLTVTAASGAFSPLADGALLGWWDASDASTITLADGAVINWADKAAGPALEQINPSSRPQTGIRTLNGLNVLDFSGSRFLETGNRSFPASGDMAFHAAFIIDGTNNAFAAILSLDATNDFQIDANNATQFDGRLNVAGIGSSVNLSGGPFQGGLILSLILDRTGAASAEVFIANTLRGSTGYTTPVDATAALFLMTNRSQNAWIDGAVGELIVTGDVSSANRADYHSYLAAKWGLS